MTTASLAVMMISNNCDQEIIIELGTVHFLSGGGAGGFCRGATRKNSDVKGGSPQEN